MRGTRQRTGIDPSGSTLATTERTRERDMADKTKEAARAEVVEFQKSIGGLREEVGKMIVGNRDVVDGVLTCMLAGSHALLEGVPGLGKTMLVRTMAEALDLQFSRIQFTPDMMPADIIGTTVIDESGAGQRSF